MASIFADFTSPTVPNGATLYKMATKPLPDKFDGSRSKHTVFLSHIRDKINECGWRHLITFGEHPNQLNLIDNSDLTPMSTVQAEKDAHDYFILIGVREANQERQEFAITQADVERAQARNFQSGLLHTVLSNSITDSIEIHIAKLKNRDELKGDGVLLLKAIQDKVLGTAINEKMANLRTKLKGLHIKQFKWNIDNFNDAVKEIHLAFESHNEKYLDTDFSDVVVANYKLVTHKEFAAMVTQYRNDCTRKKVNPDWEELMTLGETTYRSMKESGEWGRKTREEEQLIALQARCDTLEAQVAAAKHKPRNSNQDNGGSGNDDKGNGKDRRGGGKNKYKEWQFKKPEGNQREKKVKQKVNGEEKEVLYYWCPNHAKEGMWVRHKPVDCNKKPRSDGPSLTAHNVVLEE